jgi:hypothetical protein
MAIASEPLVWSGRQDGGVLSLSHARLGVGTTRESGSDYATLVLPEAGLTSDVGRPEVPVYRRLVEVPYDCDVKVSANVGETETRQLALPVIPSQPPVPKSGPALAFVFDAKLYSTDAYAPEIGAQLVEVAVMRGRRVAVVEIHPVSYNPVRNIVEYAPQMRVTVKWTGANWARTRAALRRYSSPPFTGRLDGIAVNEKQFRTYSGPALPIGYLIIVPDEWQSNVAPLAEWRRRKGFNVSVRTLSQVGGGGKDTVKAYIQNAYDNWSIPPSFVLLVGDVDRIGYFTGTGSGSPPTDLNFALCEGSDYWPDLDLGRASVASAAQLDSFVDKVVRYEQNNWNYGKWGLSLRGVPRDSQGLSPLSGTDWLKKAYFVASADSSHHGKAENTHKYVMAKLRPSGCECDSYYSYYHSGTPVATALNNGRAWVAYSGHGSEQGWGDGLTFHSDDVRALSNNDMIPFVQSYACLCGSFSSSSYPECFSETWIRVGRKGGIASIASSVQSFWEQDDTLERRVFDCMFDSGRVWVMGGINKAKIRLFEQLGSGGYTRRYFEMYNCMGDGAIDVYSLEPKPLVVSYASVIPLGPYTLQVSVTSGGNAVPGALVCTAARNYPDVWAAGYTNASGQVSLSFTAYVPDTIFVTVTGHNLAPHLGHCLVLPSNGPYVLYMHHTVDDSAGGNNDRIINPGETINLPMWLKNWGTQQAQGVTVRLRKTDPNITLLDTSRSIGDIGAGDSAWTGSNSFKFTVAPSCTNGYALHFTVAARDSRDSTWTSQLTIQVGAPVLGYASYRVDDPPPGGNRSGMLDPGETGDVIVTLRNDGLGKGHAVTAILRSTDARLHVVDSTGSFGDILPDSTGSNDGDRFGVSADLSIPRDSAFRCSLVVVAGDITRRLGFDIRIGSIRTVDPVPDGPRTPPLYWAYDEVDTGYDGCPVFDWVDIVGLGTRMDMTDDETRVIDLPSSFGPFRYYGQDYAQLSICSNGFIVPGSSTYDSLRNVALPRDSVPAMLAVNWDDIYPPWGNGIWYYHDSANHRFVVQWDSMPYVPDYTKVDWYEVVLYDTTMSAADGNCEFLFQYLTANKTGSTTIGIQDPTDSVGITELFNSTYAKGASPWVPGHAVKFTTDVPKVAVNEPVASTNLPRRLALLANAPNPFRGATRLRYSVPREMRLSLSVYDRTGRRVKRLFSGLAQPGVRNAAWDGRDDQGRSVAQGVYFYRLESEDATLTIKVIKVD